MIICQPAIIVSKDPQRKKCYQLISRTCLVFVIKNWLCSSKKSSLNFHYKGVVSSQARQPWCRVKFSKPTHTSFFCSLNYLSFSVFPRARFHTFYGNVICYPIILKVQFVSLKFERYARLHWFTILLQWKAFFINSCTKSSQVVWVQYGGA